MTDPDIAAVRDALRSHVPHKGDASLAALARVEARLEAAAKALEDAADTFAEMAVAARLLRHPTFAEACDVAEQGTRRALAGKDAA